MDEYYRGRMASKHEEWTYENGLLKGPAASYKWLGNALRRETDTGNTGFGQYDGRCSRGALATWKAQ
jgi:hypothetical protein